MTFLRDLQFALRSLARARGLSFTVVVTLALGIGANAAIFTLVRGVLLRPLVNRDEDKLIYIRQSARGIGAESTAFSVPEIQDLRSGVTAISSFGDFSSIGFTMIGLGEPREIQAGVVGGSYFEVMGLHPILGRLIDARDDGPKAAGVAVLTARFWKNQMQSDPGVIGKNIRLGSRSATIIGVLEPSVPYPQDTEIIANVVTSPHHMSATMVQGRVHRMTELFGRLAPGATLESARAQLQSVHQIIVKDHPDAYSKKADFRIEATLLRDQITSRARTILWVLLAASGLVFVIACSNVANLILARTVRREGELGIRAALGASTGDLRRTLLAESLILCGAGAALGVLSAGPMVNVLARYASRFSVRALDLTVDSSLLWVSALLAIAGAVLLTFIPRLPSSSASRGFSLAAGSTRMSGGTGRRLRIFAVTQIAASFMLLAGASMLLKTLLTLQSADTGLDTRHVLALNVPEQTLGRTPEQVISFYQECIRRINALPGVDHVSVGTQVPWREANNFGPGFEFSADGFVKAPGEEYPRGKMRTISGDYFASLGSRLLSGRNFNDGDSIKGAEHVVIVSQSLAKRMFPGQDALNRHVMWMDPVMKFVGITQEPRRIVGVSADVDDDNITPGSAVTVYHPLGQAFTAGRMFVHVNGNPYALVTPVTRIIREFSADQVVERAATLEDIRAEVLTPDRLNTVVFGSFAAVALLIALVGVAGVLAFSVSGRTREFGIRLAIGSQPSNILNGVIRQGLTIAGAGVIVGAFGGYALARLAGSWFEQVQMPGAAVVIASAAILLIAALVASVVPASRAARVDVMEALRAE
jgi:predicted permease